jgi:hypothetical protein
MRAWVYAIRAAQNRLICTPAVHRPAVVGVMANAALCYGQVVL